MRNTELINKNWLFKLEDQDAFKETSADEQGFRTLNLPHDWSVDYEPDKDEKTGGGGGYGKSGIAWYRKHLSIENITENEKIYLCFEGVYMDSTVYVNGKKAGGHGYGYTTFYVDITEQALEGENVIAVRVNNGLVPNSRWYSAVSYTHLTLPTKA